MCVRSGSLKSKSSFDSNFERSPIQPFRGFLVDAIENEMPTECDQAIGPCQESAEKPSYGVFTYTSTGGCAIEHDQRNLIRDPDAMPHTFGDTQKMGFGHAHLDAHDFAGGFTDMTSQSDLPDSHGEGCVFLSFPGVFTRLARSRGAKISGLNIHRDTPPKGDASIECATRCIMVFYPPDLTGSKRAKSPLAARPWPESDQGNE
jgi:hypothetical protein